MRFTRNQASALALPLLGSPEVEGVAIVERWPFAHSEFPEGFGHFWRLQAFHVRELGEWYGDTMAMNKRLQLLGSGIRHGFELCVSIVLRDSYCTPQRLPLNPSIALCTSGSVVHCIVHVCSVSLSLSLSLSVSLCLQLALPQISLSFAWLG